MRDGAQQGGDDHDGDDLGGVVLAGPPGDGAQQGVRQRAGGAERRGLTGPAVAPPAQLADGDEQAEGERVAPVGEAGPQGLGDGGPRRGRRRCG
ncbi:hypothetical protein ACFQ3Z_30720 [Streptomyces nogalater]